MSSKSILLFLVVFLLAYLNPASSQRQTAGDQHMLVLNAPPLAAYTVGADTSNGTRSESERQDADAVEILKSAANAAGGLQALKAVRGLTETGETKFFWGKDAKGSVTIQILGGNRFRMEADLPQGKSTWVVRDGVGSKKEQEKTLPMSSDHAINLGNLTYPIANVAAALVDATTKVSFIGIEKHNGRSAYRLRLAGHLGLSAKAAVERDLLVDALNFDVVRIEDLPISTFVSGQKPLRNPTRVVEFGDFRSVSGVRIPFSISTSIRGKQTLDIQLQDATFNAPLSDEDFRN
jgi:hypothetical protein